MDNDEEKSKINILESKGCPIVYILLIRILTLLYTNQQKYILSDKPIA